MKSIFTGTFYKIPRKSLFLVCKTPKISNWLIFDTDLYTIPNKAEGTLMTQREGGRVGPEPVRAVCDHIGPPKIGGL